MPTVQLDPSLIGGGGVNAFQNAYNNSLKMRASQQEIDDNQYKMDALREDRGQQNALARLLSTQNFDPRSAAGQSQMYGAGGVKNTQGYLKSQSDIAETGAKASKEAAGTRKIDLENHAQKFDLLGQIMQGVTDQASYDTMRAQALKIPELADLAPNIPPVYDPVQIKSNYQKAMTVKDSINAELERMKVTETGRHNLAGENETRAHNIDTATDRQLTREQQNAQYNLTRGDGLNAPKGVQVQTDNGPVFADPRTGRSIPITGANGQPLPAIEKPLNDSQSKALVFGERMRQSDKIINSLATEGTKSNVPGMDAPFVGGLVTALSSDNQQMLKQAKTDFMTALLRRESGAAISSGEFTTADKQYFPQIGNGESLIAQKAANRQLALTGVLQEVPSKQRDSIRPQTSSPTSSQDSAAMTWAKSNPNDPRAAKILQHLGR